MVLINKKKNSFASEHRKSSIHTDAVSSRHDDNSGELENNNEDNKAVVQSSQQLRYGDLDMELNSLTTASDLYRQPITSNDKADIVIHSMDLDSHTFKLLNTHNMRVELLEIFDKLRIQLSKLPDDEKQFFKSNFTPLKFRVY